MQRLNVLVVAALVACGMVGGIGGGLHAQPAASVADRIVAVVNEQVITESQLNARTELTRRQMGLPALEGAQQQSLKRRTLATLVDEELQRQYAARSGLLVTRAELSEAKAAAQKAMGQATWESLNRGLGSTAEDKLRAELVWQQVQAQAVRPNVQLGTMEIDRLIEDMSKSRQREEREISIIMLPEEANVSASAPRARLEALRAEILSSTTPAEAFAAAAKMQSADSSAAAGGLLGWVGRGELPPALESTVGTMAEGDISQPIPSNAGWALVRVNAVRTNTQAVSTQPRTDYNLYLLAASVPSATQALNALQQTMAAQTKQLTTEEQVKAAMVSRTTVLAAFPRSAALGWVPAEALQPEVLTAVRQTKIGRWSPEVRMNGQLSRLFVAASKQVVPEEVQMLRQRVGQNLMNSRLELESRRFVRELRQRAFIDIRL